MAELHFDGQSSAPFPPYFNPNIIFRNTPDDPSPALPTRNVPIYILASIRNAGSRTQNANVKFWVCNPATVPTPNNARLVGTSNFQLERGETKEVLCVSAWTPQWINDGHECIICEATAANDAASPHPNAGWNIEDRHVAQRNVDVVFDPPSQFSLLRPMAAAGLFHSAAAKLSIRPAPEELFAPTLKMFGVKTCKNISKGTEATLVADYVLGAPAPKGGKSKVDLKGLRPNDSQRFHALLQLPVKDRSESAALVLVEQHDDNGRLVGGVAVFVVGGARPSLPKLAAITPAIPATIPFRPYASNLANGFMNHDGLFVSNLGNQLINVETRNDGGSTLDGISIYVEGIADPNIVAPLTVNTPLTGSVLSQASFKSMFLADFKRASPGETVVSFIVQQNTGSTAKFVRILKKIFVLSVAFDKPTKTFEVKVPQGSIYVHIDRAIAPKAPIRGEGGHNGKPGGGCCCCCGSGGSDNTGKDPAIGDYVPYPIFIKSGTLLVIPSPHYNGTHGPLPFNDPFWKAVGWVIAGLLALAGAIVAAAEGDDEASVGPEGTFEETDPSVDCCKGTQAQVQTSSYVAAGLFALAGVAAAVTAALDEADWHERGQNATPPDPKRLTTGEFVKFDIDYTETPTPGVPFKGKVNWDYERVLDNGQILRHSEKDDPFQNIHYLKSYKVSINGQVSPDRHYTHTSRIPLVVGAQFVKPDGSLFRGSDLYVFALFVSNRQNMYGVELRDDGYGYLAGFGDQRSALRAFHEGAEDAPPKGSFTIASQKLRYPRSASNRLVSESGAYVTPGPNVAGAAELTASDKPAPNVGAYVGAATGLASYGGPTTWYVFVFAQDVNRVREGTDPRIAAKTIGGFLLTDNFVMGFRGDPCQLNYDAVLTYVGGTRRDVN